MKKIIYLVLVALFAVGGWILFSYLDSNGANTVSGTTESKSIKVSTRPPVDIK